MIRFLLLLTPLAFGPALRARAQSFVSRPAAQRAVDFATWQHSQRVLREKMTVLCARPDPLPKEKAWCLIWTDGLNQRLAAVTTVEQTPAYATLDSLLLPFTATRAEAAAFRTALRTRLGTRDSVEVAPTLNQFRAYLVGPDSLLLGPITQFLQPAAPPAPKAAPRPETATALPLPEPVGIADAVAPAPDPTPWKLGTLAASLLALGGWGYALWLRQRASEWRAKAERLQRDLHDLKSSAWFERLNVVRSQDASEGRS